MPSNDPRSILEDDLLERMRERAETADAENAFPSDDLDALRDIGYLRLLVPRELGGQGRTLEQAVRCQRRLASAAPATALAVNMHHVWAAALAILRERGDESGDWMLREIADGAIYALGISEPGNDSVLFDSTVRAVPHPDGGLVFSGVKIFTSLSPVWTRLVVFGRDDSGDRPRIRFGVVHREDPGVHVRDDWNTVGMRATQSHSTILDEVHVPEERIVGDLPVGPNAEPLTFAIFAAFLLLVGSCYVGVGQRAIELAREAAQQRRSAAKGMSFADDPQIREIVAGMAMRHLSASVQVESTARDVDESAPHGSSWFPRLTGASLVAKESARRLVEDAFEIVGGAGYHADHELGRLYRDVAASIFHPSQARSVRQTFANWVLGPVGQEPADATVPSRLHG